MKKIFAKIAAILVAAFFVLGGCGDHPGQKRAKPHNFPKVQPPAMFGQDGMLVYIATNYWRPFIDSSEVFSQDTSLIGGVPKEQFAGACHEYARILFSIPLADGIKAQTNFINRLVELERKNPENTIFDSAVEFTEEVFYGVNSDFRNEELYLPFAATLAKFEGVNSISRERYAQEAINCSKNRIGAVAADFHYTTKDGRRSTLHKTAGEYTLLFFSNPGCTACKEIIGTLGQSLAVQKLFSEGRLAVINIYIDEDLAQWYKYMPIYPENWINCHNEDLKIRGENLYDVRAIPSLYLLDREKRVILKDAPVNILMEQLHRL